jgi:hypothetical protein
LIILIVAGYLAYTYFAPGPLSEEEQELKRIEKAFDKALSQYSQATRMAGVSGMDITFDVEDILGTAEKLRRDLVKLKARITEDSVFKKAERLEDRMNKFLSDSRYK